MNKKAQAEIIGLVIIVIMITMGMLFMAQFAIKEKPEKKIFTRKGLAYSSMSAIMKTTAWCLEINKPLSIGKELLEDCAKNYCCDLGEVGCEERYSNSGCVSSSLFQCSYNSDSEIDSLESSPPGAGVLRPRHSCDFLNNIVAVMLDETLGQWNKNYQFKSDLIRGGGSEAEKISLINVERGDCSKSKDKDSSGLFPIQVQGVGLVQSTLFLCD